MPTTFTPALPGTVRGPFMGGNDRIQFMVRAADESWIPVFAHPKESEHTCRKRAQEIAHKVIKEQNSMPHREATDYFEHAYQAVNYYRKYDCDAVEVERKIRDGEIIIGEPPEKMGAIRRAPGGHFHYEYPDIPAPDKTEAQLRALHKGLPRFQKIDDEWADDKDPIVLAKSKFTGRKPDSNVQAVLLNCRLDGLNLFVPPERLDPKHFAKVKKEIVTWGGKWNTSKQCFTFTKDPSDKIAHFLDTGEIVNEKKDRQAFFTPPDIVAELIDIAGITRYHGVLEPSAGEGAIALACVAAGASSVTCCELDPDACAILRMTGKFSVVLEGDFLGMDLHTGDHPSKFERIIMNPPFTRNQDVAHVLAAYEYLADHGVLVAVMPDKDVPKLAHLNPETVSRLPVGAFKASGTNVATRIIRITK